MGNSSDKRQEGMFSFEMEASPAQSTAKTEGGDGIFRLPLAPFLSPLSRGSHKSGLPRGALPLCMNYR